MKLKVSRGVDAIVIMAIAIAIVSLLSARATASDPITIASSSSPDQAGIPGDHPPVAVRGACCGIQMAQAAQLHKPQPGYTPQPPAQGPSHQTLTLPQVGPPPPQTQSQDQERSVEVPLQRQPQATVGRISITATDRSGRWIQDLRKQDIAVYEDNVRRQVLGIQRDAGTPISIGIVVDTSGSMAWKLAAAEAALQHFVRTLNPRDQFFLIAFSDRAFLLQDFTDRPADLNHAIAILHAYGNTALYDAVVQGIAKVERGRWPKKVLLVLTDGMNNASSHSLNDAIEAARRGGVLIYTVGLGTTPVSTMPMFRWGGGTFRFGAGPPMGAIPGGQDERVEATTLRTLSDETGATTFVMNPRVVDMSRLDAHFQAISAELRQQYTVRYASAGGDRVHQIRVEATRPGMDVRAPKYMGSDSAGSGG